MKVIVAPGRFSTSPVALASDLHSWTETPGVSVVFTSEVAAPNRAAVLPVDGWTLTHRGTAGKGECALLTKDARWTVLEQTWLRLTDGGGKRRLRQPIYAPAVVAENPFGHVVVFTGAHLPAHVETLWRLIPLPRRTKVKLLMRRSDVIGTYATALHAWRAQTMHLAAKHHADDVCVMADWNLNAHSGWVQEFVESTWPGLHVRASKAPDMGRRTIGFVLTTMRKVGAEVVKAHASDHRAGVYTLEHVNTKPVNAPKPPKAEPPPDPFEHCTYNGALMDQKTKVAVQLGEKRLGYSLTIEQGCYHPGVSQSAGTHDGGGVIDFAPFDFANKVRVFREMGWFIWHRLPIPGVWGEHIHGGIRNHGKLSPSAARQQDDYDGTPPRDGLAQHSVDTTKPHPNGVGFSYLAAWHEING
jgi:hypothetical protein